MLAAAGVLKFVDEQVVDAVGNREGGVGGLALGGLEDAECGLRDLGVVDRAGLGKDNVEFGCGAAKQREAGADDLPVVLGVAGRRERADGGKSGLEAGNVGEARDEIEDLRLLLLAIRRKSISALSPVFGTCR